MSELQIYEKIKCDYGERMNLEEQAENPFSLEIHDKNKMPLPIEPDPQEPEDENKKEDDEEMFYKNYIQISVGNISIDIGSVNHNIVEIKKVLFEILGHIKGDATEGKQKDLAYLG